MAKPNKGLIKELTIRLSDFPTSIRCSLSNCPSNIHSDRGGALLFEVVGFRGELRVKKTCRLCGALYELEIYAPPSEHDVGTGGELWTRKEVMRRLKISERTLDRYQRDGILVGYRFDRSRASAVRFKREEIFAALKPINSKAIPPNRGD